MVPNSTGSMVALGVPGVRIAAGDHLCAFYRGLAERDEILIPFLREGILAGDKCICVMDTTEPETVLAALAGEVDIAESLSDNRLDVQRSRDTYLRGNQFRTDRMIDFWDAEVGGALHQGFHFARAVGEMTWSLRDVSGVEELVAYESQLNRFLPRYPQVILCLYDLNGFCGKVLMGVLKTHPKVLFGGMLVANPYYLEPDEFLAGRL